MTSIHDFSENVDEIVERYFTSLVLCEISVHDGVGISEISHVEGVGHVPSLGSESLSLDEGGVEEAEGEEDGFGSGVLFFDFFFGEVGPGSVHVGLESGGGLVG